MKNKIKVICYLATHSQPLLTFWHTLLGIYECTYVLKNKNETFHKL